MSMADFMIGVPDEIARLSLGQSNEGAQLPSPPKQSAGVVPVDITQQFITATKTLQPGELIKDGFFTLFDSVAALEIMDPKMDSGCVAAGEDFEELYNVSRSLLPEEVLGIIDQLLCHEMSWHMGYPLSQTVLTSVYIEALSMPDPPTIDEAKFSRSETSSEAPNIMLEVLRAYCLGVLKVCGYVNERIKNEHYYEEEDFVTNTYNRTLLSSIPTNKIRDTITEALGLLETRKDSLGVELFDALAARLNLRRVFLDAVESPQHIKNPDMVRKPWAEALPLLDIIKATHTLGKPVEEAFSAKLQRKLASTMPPRAIVQLGFNDAFTHLCRLFQDGFEVVSVLWYTDSQCLLTFVRTFQSKKPQPMVYIRTLLQTFLFDSMEVLGSMSIRQLLDDDFSIISLPASVLLDRINDEIEAVQDPRFMIAQQMELFRQRAAQPFLDVFRTMCQNRCRIRRTLCHVIRDWENLQLDAEEIDQILQVQTKERPMIHQSSMGGPASIVHAYSLPLSSWAFLYKVRLMEEVVQLGFELQVYQPDELAGMYWYLTFLGKSRLQHTERIKSFVIQRVTDIGRESSTMDPTAEKELHRSLSHIRLALLDAAVTWELADALSCLYTVLYRLHLIKPIHRPYSTDELRYELRMKPFAVIGLPILPTFQEFTVGTSQPDASSEELLEYANRAILGAKKGLEAMSKLSAEESFSVGSHDKWVAAIKSGLKSCIAAGIAISTIQKALQNTASSSQGLAIKAEVPSPDDAYHRSWLIPKIVPG